MTKPDPLASLPKHYRVALPTVIQERMALLADALNETPDEFIVRVVSSAVADTILGKQTMNRINARMNERNAARPLTYKERMAAQRKDREAAEHLRKMSTISTARRRGGV